jgi:hypothetical protein
MRYHPVGSAIGKSTSEGPELIVEIDPADEEPTSRPRRKVAVGQLDLFG